MPGVGVPQKGQKCMRKDIHMVITLALTLVCPFASGQSLVSISTPKSSRIDLGALAKKANSGSTLAQFQLGLAYQFGKGVDRDIHESIRWYRMAANNGEPGAQNNLGTLYETGPKEVRDLVEATK
jgi:TPR repeat protein